MCVCELSWKFYQATVIDVLETCGIALESPNETILYLPSNPLKHESMASFLHEFLNIC